MWTHPIADLFLNLEDTFREVSRQPPALSLRYPSSFFVSVNYVHCFCRSQCWLSRAAGCAESRGCPPLLTEDQVAGFAILIRGLVGRGLTVSISLCRDLLELDTGITVSHGKMHSLMRRTLRRMWCCNHVRRSGVHLGFTAAGQAEEEPGGKGSCHLEKHPTAYSEDSHRVLRRGLLSW